MIYTRRDFGKLALTALPAARLLATPQTKPNSKFGGVQIGIIAPYSFRGMPSGADDLLKYMVQLGINSVELQSEPVGGVGRRAGEGGGGFGGRGAPGRPAGGWPRRPRGRSGGAG